MSHQVIHRRMIVVSRYFSVKILPQSFDPILIRAVRRKEVQHDPSFIPLQRKASDLAVMNRDFLDRL